MGGFSLIHWVVVILVIVLLFGAGRVSGLMGEVAKGIKSFKKGMEDEDDPAARRLSDERPLEARPIAPPPPVAETPPPAPTATPAATHDPDRQA